MINYCRNLLLSIYNFILKISASKGAPYVLAVVAFTESSIFVLPPDCVLIPMAIAKPKKSFIYATLAGSFSVAGGLFGYWLGYTFYKYLGPVLIEHFHYQHKLTALSSLYEKHSYLAIFICGFTPLPYKLITLFSGFMKTNLFIFIGASIVSRFARFYLIATLIYFYGDKAREILAKNITKITVGITVIVILLVWWFK